MFCPIAQVLNLEIFGLKPWAGFVLPAVKREMGVRGFLESDIVRSMLCIPQSFFFFVFSGCITYLFILYCLAGPPWFGAAKFSGF